MGSSILKMDIQTLQELLNAGIIDEEKLLGQYSEMKRKEILSHYTIWQNQKDGRWYTHLPDDTAPGGRILRRRTNKKDLEDEIVQFHKDHEHLPTVNDVFEMWINEKKKNILSQTVLRYRSTFEKYIKNSWFGSVRIKDLTFKLLSRFCTETIGKDQMTAKCWAGIRTDLIGILRTAKLEGLNDLGINDLKDLDISKNVFASSIILPGDDVITNREEEVLCKYIDEHSDDIVLLGIRLLFKTGLRIGELAALKYEDFDFERGSVIISRTEERIANPLPDVIPKTIITVRERTKGSRGWREIIIDHKTEELVKKIRTFNPEGEFLFMENGERIHENVWSKRLPRICAKLGIGTKAVKTKNGETVEANYVLKKSTHKSRKNYISNLLHSGVDPKFVQAQVGHTDVTTTLKYYNRVVEEFEERRDALLPHLEKL